MKSRINSYFILLAILVCSITAYFIFPLPINNFRESTSLTSVKKDDLEVDTRLDQQGGNSPNEPQNNNEKTNRKEREVIEGENSTLPIESGWRITDNFNNPQSGVHVLCTPVSQKLIEEWLALENNGEDPTPDFTETYTDTNGCFDITNLEPNCYFIRGDLPEWCPALGVLDLRNGRPDKFTAIMARGKTIRGTVLDCNQNPIKEASVYCFLMPTYPIEKMPLDLAGEVVLFKQFLQSDEDGKFVFNNLIPSRSYNLYAETDGCKPVCKVVPNTDESEQKLILKKTCVLEGRITSYDGKPLVDALVDYCEPQSPYAYFQVEVIDEEGHFRSDVIPEGLIFLTGSHDDYGHDVVKLNVRSDKTNYAELKLPKGIKVTIKVTDDEGHPLEGIRVTVIAIDTGVSLCSSMTDERGEIVVKSFNKGVRNSVYARDLQRVHSVYNGTHTFTENGELLICMHKRFPAKLVVMDETTREVISDYTLCSCSYYKSSALGELNALNTFTFEHHIKTPTFEFKVAKGEYFEYTILAEGYKPERILVMLTPGEKLEPIEVLLKRGGSLNGLVVDAETSAPIPNAQILLYINGRYDKKPAFPLSKSRSAVTNNEGSFSLLSPPDGRFFIKVIAPGYSPLLVDSYELDLTAAASENRILLSKGGGLAGKIYCKGGYPLEQAYIQIKLPGTNELLTSRSNTDGSYSICDLPPSTYTVSVWDVLDTTHSGCTMKLQREIGIKPNQQTITDFTFEDSCIVRGLCTVDGDEGSGFIIHLYNSKGKVTHSVNASITGYYKIYSIQPGNYTLEAYSTLIGAGGVIRYPLTLSKGQDLTLDLDFNGKAIHGNVSDSLGQPIHAAEVELLTPSFQRSYLTYTNNEGNYSIYSVEEGDYIIAARAPGCGEEMKGPWRLGGKGKQARKADFTLKQGGTARVHVRDVNGSHIANAKILVSNNINQGVLWTGMTKYSGMAVFENLQTESLSAIAICKDYAPASTTFVAQAGEITDAEICLVKGGSLELEVSNTHGLPVPEAQVILIGYSQVGLSLTKLNQLGLLTVSSPTFLTDEKGQFSLGLIPPGDYKVRISKGLHQSETHLAVSSDQETKIKVVLQ